MMQATLQLLQGELRGRIQRAGTTAALVAIALLMLAAAGGFAIALLYVWLQQIYGTTIALSIIAGGAAALALIVLAFALWRPRPRRQPVIPQIIPAEVEAIARAIAQTERTIEDAVTAVEQGTRDHAVSALVLAVATGFALGRKL